MPASSTGRKPTATKPLPQAGPSEQEQQDHEAGGKSNAALFNQAPPEEGFDMPLGQFRAYLVSAERRQTGKKISVLVGYEVTDHEEHEGRKLSTWYNFIDENGAPMRGIGFFKKDLGLIGRECPVLEEEDLSDIDPFLRELTDERPLCVVRVAENKGFKNLYLQGLAPDA